MSEADDRAFDAERDNAPRDIRVPRSEIADMSTREVWQDWDPTPREWYDELALEAPMIKVGLAAGNMDRSWFRRSPDGDADGPVRSLEIGGRRFFFCARAPAEMDGQSNPRRMMVDKHHSLAYASGREVEILTNDEGTDFVRVVDGSRSAPEPELPDGWRLRTIELKDEWIVHLPASAETWWFTGMISYQGPVDAPDVSTD